MSAIHPGESWTRRTSSRVQQDPRYREYTHDPGRNFRIPSVLHGQLEKEFIGRAVPGEAEVTAFSDDVEDGDNTAKLEFVYTVEDGRRISGECSFSAHWSWGPWWYIGTVEQVGARFPILYGRDDPLLYLENWELGAALQRRRQLGDAVKASGNTSLVHGEVSYRPLPANPEVAWIEVKGNVSLLDDPSINKLAWDVLAFGYRRFILDYAPCVEAKASGFEFLHQYCSKNNGALATANVSSELLDSENKHFRFLFRNLCDDLEDAVKFLETVPKEPR